MLQTTNRKQQREKERKVEFYINKDFKKKPYLQIVNTVFVFAEGERFELSVQFDPYDGLANRWFQPLTHPSECAEFKYKVEINNLIFFIQYK